MKFPLRGFLHLAAGAAALVLSPNVALPQDWPMRPVSMVVTFPAGSADDVLARILAPRLSELLGQQVIVENVGGAGGMIGVSRVAKAAPDGYQFVLGGLGTFAATQTLHSRPLYNSATDFEPVALIVEQSAILIARKDLPVHNLQEFYRVRKGKSGRDAIWLGGDWLFQPTRLRVAAFVDRSERHARPVSCRSLGYAGSDRWPD